MSKTILPVLVATFAIAGIYDLLLRWMIEGKIPAPFGIRDSPWYKSLVPYFEKQTPLAAALVAGFVGAITQIPILWLWLRLLDLSAKPFHRGFPRVGLFLFVTFLVSGLSGMAMRASGLFPLLDSTMYRVLSPAQAIWADAISGVVVNSTLVSIGFMHPSLGC